MTDTEMTDPRRTIPAAVVNGLVHKLFEGTTMTGCGLQVTPGDTCVMLMRPEDITCPTCADLKITKEEVMLLLREQPKTLAILPPEPGTCQVCACVHEPNEPHNKNSLYYQMKFHLDYGRWPTWEDAIKHCTEDMKAEWRKQLKFFGEKLD